MSTDELDKILSRLPGVPSPEPLALVIDARIQAQRAAFKKEWLRQQRERRTQGADQ